MYNQKNLVHALAVAISNRLRDISLPVTDPGYQDAFYFDHSYQTDFEVACDALWRLGISFPHHSDDSPPPSYEEYFAGQRMFPASFSLPCATEVSELLDKSQPDVWPRIEVLIEAYLRVATNYGSVGSVHLPTPRDESFSATHSDQIPVLEAFVFHGYARLDGGQYIWTDQMLPMMAHICGWNDRDFDQSLVDASEAINESLRILDSLNAPNERKPPHDLWILSVSYRALEIQHYWDGKRWLDYRSDDPKFTFHEALAISLLLESESAT